ncbi:GNAT family N-acetyltransferase [Lentzea tibetensis]|uniref:GNAT family N-acetyltransferase n=2 Tax=Lentzea tibetensis TaxID=2591470 RepID=A0A563ESM2_9PSEU|nr:GNAT family N-acetyltransferase [Lentzea tibetensis]
MLAELTREYASRYGDEVAHAEMTRHHDDEFAPPHGSLLLLMRAGGAVAGGALRRCDERTAELKRVWTHSAHRRRGLARQVVAALENEAVRLGYRRLRLTTGPRQPEARSLYLATGYTPLFDVHADPLDIGLLAFEKALDTRPALTSGVLTYVVKLTASG